MEKNIWRNEGNYKCLEQNFIEEEIKTVVWRLAPEKAPELNGFPIIFYKLFWRIIKKDLIKLIEEVYIGKT